MDFHNPEENPHHKLMNMNHFQKNKTRQNFAISILFIQVEAWREFQIEFPPKSKWIILFLVLQTHKDLNFLIIYLFFRVLTQSWPLFPGKDWPRSRDTEGSASSLHGSFNSFQTTRYFLQSLLFLSLIFSRFSARSPNLLFQVYTSVAGWRPFWSVSSLRSASSGQGMAATCLFSLMGVLGSSPSSLFVNLSCFCLWVFLCFVFLGRSFSECRFHSAFAVLVGGVVFLSFELLVKFPSC